MHAESLSSPARGNRSHTVWLFLFLVSTVACLVSKQPVLFVAGAGLCALFALVNLATREFAPRTLVKLALFALLFVPAFLKPAQGLTPVFYALATMATILAAWALVQFPPAQLARAFQWLYFVSTTAICIGLLIHFGEHEPLGLLLPDTSTNGIPSYILVLQVGRSLSHFKQHGRLPQLSPWITAWIAFVGIGRASLVVAGLIVAATLAFTLLARQGGVFAPLLRFLLALVVVSLLLVLGPGAYDWIAYNTKLATGFVDTHRIAILGDYWQSLDAWSLLVGREFAGTIVDELYNGNPHIAFLRTHAFFGLPLTLLALFSPLVVLWSPVTWRHKCVYMCFCGLLVLRATTEPILFPTLFDLIYFACLMLPFRRDTITSPPNPPKSAPLGPFGPGSQSTCEPPQRHSP